jgi:dihydrofolate reductase
MKGIIAMNNLGYIGIDNKLLWKSTEDLSHFVRSTLNQRLLVGYNTSLDLPPLKNRTIIVDKRDELTLDVDWCIGGKKTYEKYCQYFTELHISHIDNNSIGDIMFPDLRNLNPNCKIYNYNFKS